MMNLKYAPIVGLLCSFFLLQGLKSPLIIGGPSQFSQRLQEKMAHNLKYYSFMSNPNAKNIKKFYIQGALHGNEKLTTEFVIWLTQRLNNGSSPLLSLGTDNMGLQIDLVPIANPDGYANGSRYNSNHVNLNRNFSIFWGLTQENPGLFSFSEQETQAIRHIFSQNHYVSAVDVHGYTNMVVTPSSFSSSAPYQQWKNMVAATTKKLLKGYEVTNGKDLGDGGAFEDWAFWQNNTPAICLELLKPERYLSQNGEFNKSKEQDSFLLYENYISTIFAQAEKIDFSQNHKLVTRSPSKASEQSSHETDRSKTSELLTIH